MSARKQQRNDDLIEFYTDDHTLHETADKFEVSVTRAREIIEQFAPGALRDRSYRPRYHSKKWRRSD